MEHKLERIGREVVYPGTVLNFCKDTMRLPTGKIEEWDFLQHKKGGGACVVPVLPDGRILMIRQYRPAVDRETLELPAGAKDAEDPDTSVTARRELEEETGYTCEKILPLVKIQTAVAYCNEYTDIYLAENLRPLGGQSLDEAEEIRTEAFAKEELLERIYAGEIRDAKTVAGIMAYAAKGERKKRSVPEEVEMILIKNGYVIDPKSRMEGKRDLYIANGRILKIEEAGASANTSHLRVIDAHGCIVAPGLVDVHVHFRDPGFTQKEDILTGAAAAARGGFTTVIMMANTRPPIDNVETLGYCLDKGKKTRIHVLACANVTCGMKGKTLTDMEALANAGAAGFTDDGVPIRNSEIARAAMEQAAKLGLPISFHEEDPSYIDKNGINHGKASEFYGNEGSDRMAEISMVERDLKLALETGAKIDIQHISTREAVELVREAKKQGKNIHAEATPHHFTLTEKACIKYGAFAKMNPPLREEEDRMAIVRGLADGTIDMIATDHAPHTTAEKRKVVITEAPSGIIGLETSLALGITELVDKGYLKMVDLMDRMSLAPAELYGLDAGYIAEGGPADLVIFDPTARFIAGDYASKAENTPFTGWELTGRVEYTICGGRVVYAANRTGE